MNIGLLVLLFVCHWLADYTHLSRPYMLAAKRIGKPLSPIFHHALMHAFLMGIVCNAYLQLPLFNFQWDLGDKLFLMQLLSHFIIDVWKGKMNVWFPKLANPANPYHWYIFGFDQSLHILVIIIMWYLTLPYAY